MTSRTFSTKKSSVLSVNVSVRHGRSLNAFQIRLTEDWLTPDFLASLRVLQCVAPAGLLSSVIRPIVSTLSSSSLRCTLGRGLPAKPEMLCGSKRRRHLPAVVRKILSFLATCMCPA